MIKDLIHRGVLTIVNIHVPKQQKSRINEKEKKRTIQPISGDINIQLSAVERRACTK